MKHVIALFGEAESGQFHTPYHFHDLADLAEVLGNPPEDSLGLHLSIQALLYNRELIFFRVEEEGFSLHDYHFGLRYLRTSKEIKRLDAVCMPGMGNKEIIKHLTDVCHKHRSLILISEKDFYDYVTDSQT